MALRNRRPRALSLTAGLAAGALALAGCAAGPAVGEAGSDQSSAIDLSSVTLVFGQNDGTVGPIFDASGILDELPYRVEFATFPDQVQSAAALVSGETDGSLTAQYTVVQALAASTPEWTPDTIPYVTISSTTRISPDVADWVGTVSSPKSGITTLTADDVRGKKWTTTPGATNYLTLLQTLEHLGVDYDEIEWVPLSNADGALALLNNQVDLATGAFAGYADAVSAGGSTLLSGADVGPGSPNGVIVSKKSLADPAKEAALKDFSGRLVDYYYWKLTHPDEVQKALVEDTKSTPHAAEQSWKLFHRALPTPVTPELIDITTQISTLAFAAGAIKREAPAAIQFDDRFTDVIEGRLAELGYQAAIDESVAKFH